MSTTNNSTEPEPGQGDVALVQQGTRFALPAQGRVFGAGLGERENVATAVAASEGAKRTEPRKWKRGQGTRLLH